MITFTHVYLVKENMPKRLLSGFSEIVVLILIIAVVAGAALVISRKTQVPPSPTPPIQLAPAESPTPAPSPTTTSTSNTVSALTPIPVSTPKTSATSAPTVAPVAKPASGPPGAGYSRITVSTERGSFTVSVVSIDMTGIRMVIDTASENDCPNDCPTIPLGEYVSRNGAFAGINGSYFCPADYPDCESKKNSFDFPVYNSRLNKWVNQGNLFWNNRAIIYQDGGGMYFLRNANSFNGGLTAGITNYPGLLDGGEVIVDHYPLTDKLRSKGSKTGIGLRGNVVYLVVAGNVDIYDLAHIFKSLGATHALNLDGGGSTALWYGGYKAGPGRSLPNAVLFVR